MPYHNTTRSETVTAHCKPLHISPTAKGSHLIRIQSLAII